MNNEYCSKCKVHWDTDFQSHDCQHDCPAECDIKITVTKSMARSILEMAYVAFSEGQCGKSYDIIKEVLIAYPEFADEYSHLIKDGKST